MRVNSNVNVKQDDIDGVEYHAVILVVIKLGINYRFPVVVVP